VTNVDTLAEDRFRMTADRDVQPHAARATGVASLCCGAERFPKFNSGMVASASPLARLYTIY
jgi:hypothetical protein